MLILTFRQGELFNMETEKYRALMCAIETGSLTAAA